MVITVIPRWLMKSFAIEFVPPSGLLATAIVGLGAVTFLCGAALAASSVLMFFLHLVQARQEAFIIETQAFLRDRLIDVMKVPHRDESQSA